MLVFGGGDNMNIIEKLGITPIGYIYGQLHGVEAAYCYHSNLQIIEQQRNEMLEALIESNIELEIYHEYHPKTGTGHFIQRNIKAIEKATGKTWAEIKELL
jgi:hypothetical protein